MNPTEVDILEENASKLKVCGHPVRLKILCLIEKNSSCVTDLWQCLGQPQPVISQHLAVLKEKDIVSSTTDGNRRVYSIKDPMIRDLVNRLLSQLPAVAVSEASPA